MIETEAISEFDLKRLVGFSPENGPVVSVYLDVDGAKYPRLQDCEKILRGLLQQATQDWVNGDHLEVKEQRKSVRKDLDAIEEYVRGEWNRNGTKALAIFSCVQEGFWQVYELPVSVPSALIVGPEPYAKTLTAVLNKYKRFCVVAVDRKKSRFFTFFLGAIEEEHPVAVDEWVPDQVKAGDWANLRESRINRHINDHVLRHLKQIAEITYDFFMDRQCDHLIVAGRDDTLRAFKRMLHPYLAERLAGEFALDAGAPKKEFLERSLEVERAVRRRHEEDLVRRVRHEAAVSGHGVLGLEDTLSTLVHGQAYALIAAEGYEDKGFVCYADHYLSTRAGDCPVCGRELSQTEDIVEDMVQLAINQDVGIEYIPEDTEFAQQTKVAALLRYGQRRRAAG